MFDSVDPSALPKAGAAPQADLAASPIAASPQGGGDAWANSLDLRQGSFGDRWEVAKQIPQRGEAAVPDLITMLRDETLAWETRWFAARSLGHFDHSMAITALIDALGTADEDLQEAIIDALGHIGPNAIQALSALMAEPTYQAMAIEALTRIPHSATQDPLVAAVNLTEGTNLAKVIDALGPFANLDLLPIFTDAIQNRASSVRLAALQGLIRLRMQVDESCWVALIQPLVEDVNPTVAQRAIHALGRTTNPVATQILQVVLSAPHTPERLKLATVQALAWQETVAALEAILQPWDTLSDGVRIAALQALAGNPHGSLQAHWVDRLLPWLNDLPATAEHSLLRRHCVLLLGQLGDQRVRPILQALSRDADAGVRLHAEAALHHR